MIWRSEFSTGAFRCYLLEPSSNRQKKQRWQVHFESGHDSAIVLDGKSPKAQAKTDAVAALKKHLTDTLAELEKLEGGSE